MENEENKAQEAQTYDGGITPEQVAQMKAKHRKAFRIDIVDGADTHVGYFKRPDFDTIKAVTKVSKVDEVEAGKIMFDKCWGAARSCGRTRYCSWLCRRSWGRCSTAAWGR